jgi:hypothetical protein
MLMTFTPKGNLLIQAGEKRCRMYKLSGGVLSSSTQRKAGCHVSN